MAWTIKGEAGKTLDATERTLEQLNIGPHGLHLGSLEEDVFNWTAETLNATGAGTIVPDAGQRVEVFAGATRIFRGHAAKPRVGLRNVTVQVLGPWWWLNRVSLSGEQADGSGAVAQRASFVFPTQDLRTSLIALATRAIAMGVPIALGTVAAMYAVPKITLANMSFAAALAELMRWCPDAVMWFDYTGSGLPILNISRRGGMSTLTRTVGTDPLEDVEIAPRLDLEVSRVDLKFVTRAVATGRPQWASQASGTATDGKIQIVTVSGPEIVDFLPRDDFDSVAVRTVTWTAVSNAFVLANDSALASIQKDHGGVFGGVGTTWTYWTGSSDKKILTTRNFPPLALRSITGATIPTGTQHLVISPTPLPEWARQLLGAVEVEITGTWIAAWRDSERGTVGWNATFTAMREGAAYVDNVWENGNNTFNGSGSPSDFWRIDWLARPVSFRGYVIKTAYAALTSVYKPWDYDYLHPPAGLAAALTSAQNWVPWEGQITEVGDTVSGANVVQQKINLANGYAPCATMGALLRSVDYDGLRGRTTYTLGAPARTDFGSLVSRIRRDPKDNIVYL